MGAGLDDGRCGAVGAVSASRASFVVQTVSSLLRACCAVACRAIRWYPVRTATRLPIAVLLIAAGALLVLYGALAPLYQGDGSGTTHVTIAGNEMNAHLAGGISLAIGTGLLASGLLVIRRHVRGSEAERRHV